MRLKFVSWLLILFLVPFVFAQGSLYTAQSIDFDFSISSDLTIKSASSYPDVDYVESELLLIPQDTPRQQVESLESSPAATATINSLLYRWEKPTEKTLSFSMNAKIKTINTPPLVRSRISFPLSTIPPAVVEYTQPSETIDSNHPAIIAQASELADGEDDLAQVVFKLASWTEDTVVYDLSTLTAEVSQKSSWVLENKIGVCDEMTSLFIAMARSLGIPARFVSGMAYTTSELFDENWQAHGWAEVYFPTIGWIPYDPTFGQYGAIDPTHIKLQDSIDPIDPSTRYEWRGNDIDLEFSPIDFDVQIINQGPQEDPTLKLVSSAQHELIGFGSWNVILTEVENTQNYYQATTLRIATPPEVNKAVEKQAILLKPGEKKKVYWPLSLPTNLEDRFVYTFPVSVVTEKNISSSTSFQSRTEEVIYTKKDVDEFITFETFEKSKSSKEAEIACDPVDAKAGETFEIVCRVKNTGNTILSNVNACIENKCSVLDIPINQEEQFSAALSAGEPGRKKASVKVSAGTLKKLLQVTYQVLDEPSIVIEDLSLPKSVSYEEQVTFSFLLKKDSFMTPQDVTIEVQRSGLGQSFHMDALDQDKQFNIVIDGSDFDAGENTLTIIVTWKDQEGKEYSTQAKETVDLENLTFTQRVAVFFKSLTRGLEKLFS